MEGMKFFCENISTEISSLGGTSTCNSSPVQKSTLPPVNTENIDDNDTGHGKNKQASTVMDGLDLEDSDDILKEDVAVDPSSKLATTTTTTTTAAATAPKEDSPGIPIPERKKTKEQHLKQCTSGGKSRYKKKYKKPGDRKPTINSRLDQANTDPAYRKFFGEHQGSDGLLDEVKMLAAFSGVTPDPDHLILETMQFHKKVLLDQLHIVSPKLKLSDD